MAADEKVVKEKFIKILNDEDCTSPQLWARFISRYMADKCQVFSYVEYVRILTEVGAELKRELDIAHTLEFLKDKTISSLLWRVSRAQRNEWRQTISEGKKALIEWFPEYPNTDWFPISSSEFWDRILSGWPQPEPPAGACVQMDSGWS